MLQRTKISGRSIIVGEIFAKYKHVKYTENYFIYCHCQVVVHTIAKHEYMILNGLLSPAVY